MPIPHAEHLHVSQAKLHGYLLDPDHPFGEAKLAGLPAKAITEATPTVWRMT